MPDDARAHNRHVAKSSELQGTPTLRIGVISDTHGPLRPEATQRLAGTDHTILRATSTRRRDRRTPPLGCRCFAYCACARVHRPRRNLGSGRAISSFRVPPSQLLFVDHVFTVDHTLDRLGDCAHALVVVEDPADFAARRTIVGDCSAADILDHHESDLAREA
jgi:hypothetical protein